MALTTTANSHVNPTMKVVCKKVFIASPIYTGTIVTSWIIEDPFGVNKYTCNPQDFVKFFHTITETV